MDTDDVLNTGLVRATPIRWGVEIEYDPAILDDLRNYELTDDAIDVILEEIATKGPETNASHVIGPLWMDDFQWTTGIVFDGEVGGGYDISFSWGDANPRLSVLVEWFDDRAAAAGQDERQDEATCLRIGLETLQDWLANL